MIILKYYLVARLKQFYIKIKKDKELLALLVKLYKPKIKN